MKLPPGPLIRVVSAVWVGLLLRLLFGMNFNLVGFRLVDLDASH
jgi:hypothetical protein